MTEDYRCPSCKSADSLSVSVVCSAKLTQKDGNIETEVEGDHEWDNSSTMWCACGYSDMASSFLVEK